MYVGVHPRTTFIPMIYSDEEEIVPEYEGGESTNHVHNQA